MKLFYHFLIFVFVSLLLVACANIFTTNSKAPFSDKPSGLNRDNSNHADGLQRTKGERTADIAESFNYRSLLKARRWTDNQCYYKDVFGFKNIQTAIRQIAGISNIYKN